VGAAVGSGVSVGTAVADLVAVGEGEPSLGSVVRKGVVVGVGAGWELSETLHALSRRMAATPVAR